MRYPENRAKRQMFESIIQANPMISREIQVRVISITLRYLEKVKVLDGLASVETLIKSGLTNTKEGPEPPEYAVRLHDRRTTDYRPEIEK